MPRPTPDNPTVFFQIPLPLFCEQTLSATTNMSFGQCNCTQSMNTRSLITLTEHMIGKVMSPAKMQTTSNILESWWTTLTDRFWMEAARNMCILTEQINPMPQIWPTLIPDLHNFLQGFNSDMTVLVASVFFLELCHLCLSLKGFLCKPPWAVMIIKGAQFF